MKSSKFIQQNSNETARINKTIAMLKNKFIIFDDLTFLNLILFGMGKLATINYRTMNEILFHWFSLTTDAIYLTFELHTLLNAVLPSIGILGTTSSRILF